MNISDREKYGDVKKACYIVKMENNKHVIYYLSL